MPPFPTLQARFHAEMLAIYQRCANAGFRPVLFRRQVMLQGGVAAAKALVFAPGSTGLERLQAIGRPDLSMEAAMLQPDFAPLFSVAERREAEQRLAGEVSRERARGRLQTPIGGD